MTSTTSTTSKCLCPDTRDDYTESIVNGVTWYQCDRCDSVWRATAPDPAPAAPPEPMLRMLLDDEQFDALVAAFDPDVADAPVGASGGTVGAHEASRGIDSWLAGLELDRGCARDGGPSTGRAASATATAPGAPDTSPAQSCDTVDRWLDGLEAGPVHTDDARPVEPVDVPRGVAPEVDTWSPVRVAVDDWLDAGNLGNVVQPARPTSDPAPGRPGRPAAKETVVAVQAGPDTVRDAGPAARIPQPVPSPSLRTMVTRLDDFHADLVRVEHAFGASDAQFARIMRRWRPPALPMRGAA